MLLLIFQMVGASFLLVLLLMVALWCVYYVKRNAGIVDIGWTVGFLVTAVAYYLLGQGSWIKSSVLLLMVTVWSGRLAWHLYQRYLVSPEDARYRQIRARWGERNSDFKFLILFVFQGVLVVVLSLPFLLVSCCPNPFWSVWEVLGIVVWACGVAGEYFADEQLQAFKRLNPNNPELVCSEGLWHYTRHPNYFFEWLVWVGYFLYAFPATLGFLAILSPLIMYYLLRYVSGVPLAEEQLVRNKGDAYRTYQKKTSEFFPWFPR
jgi:steroid 5-alpha reductase family enzyme